MECEECAGTQSDQWREPGKREEKQAGEYGVPRVQQNVGQMKRERCLPSQEAIDGERKEGEGAVVKFRNDVRMDEKISETSERPQLLENDRIVPNEAVVQRGKKGRKGEECGCREQNPGNAGSPIPGSVVHGVRVALLSCLIPVAEPVLD
jgi:hypothetical protein